MGVSVWRICLCWAISAILPVSSVAQTIPDKPPVAILHAQGGVWVNGYEAHDSSSVFVGDVIETKPDASANLTMDGSTVLLAPQSVSKFEGDLLELDHGGVSVTTSKGFKVQVNCIVVVPVLNEWTQYSVTDINGAVEVAARKLDVNVDHQRGRSKDVAEPQPSQTRASVHEGEQKSYEESDVCGAGSRPTTAGQGINPKWIYVGGAGGGAALLIWLLFHGGDHPKPPDISPSAP